MGSSQSRIHIDATYRGVTVSIRRKEAVYYDNLRTLLHIHFPRLSKDVMIIQTKDFDICKGEYVDVPDELWVDMSPRIRSIRIVVRSTVTRPHPKTYLEDQTFYDVDEDLALSPKQCYIVATMGENSVFVSRGRVTNYKDLVASLVRYFPALAKDHVVVQTSERSIDIPPQLWPDISRYIENIKVISRRPIKITVFVELLTGETKSLTLTQSALVSDLADLVYSYNKYFEYEGEWLKFDHQLSNYNIREGSTVHQVEHSSKPCNWGLRYAGN
ncbi:hypothetical protein EDD18DRAFT_1190292 [Armillaria luteobubalina]|uniref:Ubiquitin-like domain-containing protein n=1 Tax=Armillaria luteobubalina TaxID=153913 RepID=A0AA39PPS6_9AGAR|nr:hypothetical protein EDD18DRAFT_1190292 [Armillaria luteobubalina]